MEFLKDLYQFIQERKKWWLLPVIFLLLLISMLILFSNTALAPFIYTLF